MDVLIIDIVTIIHLQLVMMEAALVIMAVRIQTLVIMITLLAVMMEVVITIPTTAKILAVIVYAMIVGQDVDQV
jgi:hypothetical protein